MIDEKTLNYLLSAKKNVMLIVSDDVFSDYIFNLTTMSRGHIGLISKKFPFLSNLSIVENICLGLMYVQNISLRRCINKIYVYIQYLEMEDCLWLRKEQVSEEQLVKAYFLRCIANGNSVIFMDSPKRKWIRIVTDCIEKTQSNQNIWISTSSVNKGLYNDFNFDVIEISV
jgi:ABC-type lipoprotein export system ATPase subunit